MLRRPSGLSHVVSATESVPPLSPGELLTYDFRSHPTTNHSSSSLNSPCNLHEVKVVQWNIERGYQLDKVIQELVNLNADIIALQELDIACGRSDYRNNAYEIAKALGMKCIFLCEFLELDSPLRLARDKGGGYHGNAILSRFNFEARVLKHRFHPFDWERDGMTKSQPRQGERFTIVAEVEVPWSGNGNGKVLSDALTGESDSVELANNRPNVERVLVYSAHLEVFCGILGRVGQLSDILADAAEHKSSNPCQILCGDLNTMAHGIARLSPSFCTDNLRWRTLGSTEAEWLTERVLSFTTDDGPFNTHLLPFRQLPPEVLQNARNPGFYDAFDPKTDITLESYGGYYSGKLDWLLVMGLEITEKSMGNDRYEASDHKWLCCSVKVDLEGKGVRKLIRKMKSKKTRWRRWRSAESIDENEMEDMRGIVSRRNWGDGQITLFNSIRWVFGTRPVLGMGGLFLFAGLTFGYRWSWTIRRL
ncbi:Endonuclease/exonuclease/phosphatase [Paraphysoderma sedebokerense]|nr:Endonuclease/exonuclease/phosphatase [Paraphysoderma sedebokerense]